MKTGNILFGLIGLAAGYAFVSKSADKSKIGNIGSGKNGHALVDGKIIIPGMDGEIWYITSKDDGTFRVTSNMFYDSDIYRTQIKTIEQALKRIELTKDRR